MPYRIAAPVDCKRPEWQPLVDAIVQAGSIKPVRGKHPEGLPPGGWWEYRKRAQHGRVYIMYHEPIPGGTKNQRRLHTIGSVDPDHAQAAVNWKPRPNCERQFDFDSGPVLVHYDALALPYRITAMRQP